MLNILFNLVVFPVEQVIELCYDFSWRVSRSHGFSIFGVSLAVSTLVLPIYLMAERQQKAERDKQSKMRGEAANIKAVFKGDKQYMLLSTLYRQNNYHPLYALRGSLDLFIQIPFFIAAYHFLHNLAVFKGQVFFFIKDLGSPDALLFGINLLPILMTLINCVSGAVYTKGLPLKDKLQLYGMAAVFLILLYNSPAALVLYWTSNNIYNLIKNIIQKTKYPGKIVSAIVVSVAVLFAFFVLFVHHGNFEKRLLTAVPALLIVVIFFLKKKIFCVFTSFVKKYGQKGFSLNADIKTFALSAGVLFLLAGLVIPAALISSSVEEFSYINGYINPFGFIQSTISQSAGIFLAWGFFLYVLLDKKTKPLLSVFFAAFAVLAVINTFFFRGDYGDITNLLLISNIRHAGSNIFLLSAAVNAAAFAIVLILCFIPKKIIINSVLSCTAASCLVFGIVNAAKIQAAYSAIDKNESPSGSVHEPEPEYTFSRTGKNVVFIMLDRAFAGFVPSILTERPQLKDQFSGFIFYPNTVAFMGHTLMGSPPVYGGYEYTPLEMNRRSAVSMIDKHNEALLLVPRLFLENGFNVVTTDPPLSGYAWIPDLKVFENYPGIHASNILYSKKYLSWWEKSHSLESLLEEDASNVIKYLHNDLIRFSFFRTAFPFIRRLIYDDGQYHEIRQGNLIDPLVVGAYATLDILPKITNITTEDQNNYNAVYSDLSHQPSSFQFLDDESAQEVFAWDTGAFFREDQQYLANAASWLLLSKWFVYLKENGVYDNTRIIIAADHGISDRYLPPGSLDSKTYAETLPGGDSLNYYNPLLLFKDFNSGGALQVDSAFMTNADVPLLSLAGLVDNPVNPFTGKALSYDKKDGVIITTSHFFIPEWHEKFRYKIKRGEWLHVKDNIFDMNNWQRVQPDQ